MKTHILPENCFVALDVGTTKMCVLVGEKTTDHAMNLIGIGKSPSAGVSRGVVTDVAQAVDAIKLALKEAELMAGYTIESVAVGISGSHVQSLNSTGMIPIKHGKIRASDKAAVLMAAKAVMLPEGQQILHVLPQYYCIDGQQRVLDPEGMHGVRLEVRAHIITGSIASVQNLISCCQSAGVIVKDVILEPLASAEAVLSHDEQELGVGILDIGGGTSDFACYQQGAIRHTKVFATAGNHVTHDIALCLRTTIKDAERIKREYASSLPSSTDETITFLVEMARGGEHMTATKKDLVAIVEPRITELAYMVKNEIEKYHLEPYIPAGIVLTGGGSLLQGIKETFETIIKMPTRVGKPHVPTIFKESLESPAYATGYGLLLYAFKSTKNASIHQLSGPLATRIFWRMKSWVADFF